MRKLDSHMRCRCRDKKREKLTNKQYISQPDLQKNIPKKRS